MRTHRRSLGVLLSTLVLAGNGLCLPAVHAQQLHLDSVALEVLKAQTSSRRFHQERAEYQRWRDRERLAIPAYNIELSRAVVVFHQHIQDMHHRHVDCKLCRQYVGRIRKLAKRIDAGMK